MPVSQLIWKPPVAAASTINVAGTFSASSSGSIVTSGSLTQPTSGTIETGTWPNVSLAGGTGSGALATVDTSASGLFTVNTIVQPTAGLNSFIIGANGMSGTFTAGDTIRQGGPIATHGTITGGTNYADGTYTAVPLTGGSGTGAQATIVVSGGIVTTVTITTAGTGYLVGDSLTASRTLLGNPYVIVGNVTTGPFTIGDNVTSAPGTGTATVAVSVSSGTQLVIKGFTGSPGATDVWTDNTGGNTGHTFGATAVPVAAGAGFSVPVATTTAGATATVATTNTNTTPLVVVTSSITGSPSATTVWKDTTTPGAAFTPTAVPSAILNGTYTGIPLTGGAGVGAVATIVVASSLVTTVTVTTSGSSYGIGDVLGFTGALLGTGGTVRAATVIDIVTNVAVTAPGIGYTSGDVLTYSSLEVGSGGTITVGVLSPSGPGDKLTASASGVLTVDGYTLVANDRVLLKNQTAGLQNGVYCLSQAPVAGIILTTGAIVQPTSGTIANGTFQGVVLTGGAGTGARATVVVAGNAVTGVFVTNWGAGYSPGDVLTYNANGQGFGNSGTIVVATVNSFGGGILTTSTIVQPSTKLITNGSYQVSLTGGTGTGARANITIVGGIVTSVVIINPGTGYLSTDVLGFSGGGLGTGGTIALASVTFTPWVLQRTADTNMAFQVNAMAVWVGGGSTLANTAWVQNTLSVTMDTTPLTFVEFIP